ncbi:MAG: HPr family phosphocarrier protein [Saprospiraceae bacterium]|nr:HPr family phosphocarrier protein [Pyrinomonadaceae bacterium]
MREGTVRIINPLGLHARAAAQLVRLADGFNSQIIIRRSDNNASANAKSILSVLTLAASIGTILILSVEGVDEENAFAAIDNIFKGGFGEI